MSLSVGLDLIFLGDVQQHRQCLYIKFIRNYNNYLRRKQSCACFFLCKCENFICFQKLYRSVLFVYLHALCRFVAMDRGLIVCMETTPVLTERNHTVCGLKYNSPYKETRLLVLVCACQSCCTHFV